MSEREKNTKLVYQYRDGDNYKVARSVVFEGAITLEMRDKLQNAMLEGDGAVSDAYGVDGFFIPGQVGLPDLQDQFYSQELAVLDAILSEEPGPEGDQRAHLQDLRDQMAATKPLWSPTSDHIYHTIEEISLTDQPATETKSIEDFVDDFCDTGWNHEYLPPCYEVMHQNFLEAQTFSDLEV